MLIDLKIGQYPNVNLAFLVKDWLCLFVRQDDATLSADFSFILDTITV